MSYNIFQGIVYIEFQLWVLVVKFRASSLSLREVCRSPFLVYKTRVLCYTTTLHFRNLFSMILVTGINTRIKRKYKIDASCPIMMYGCSTGCPPIHVSVSKSATDIQNKSWLKGWNIMLRCLYVWSIGMNARVTTESNRAKTPPSLLRIDRRIAYVNRKYHSGLICSGVLSGFAGV